MGVSEMDYLDQIAHYNIRKAHVSKKSALLVIDMQEFFRAYTPAIIENVIRLIESFRSSDIPIIFTRHGHKNLKENGGMLAFWWNSHAIYGSPEGELLEVIPVSEDDIIIDKNRYSAFKGTGLDDLLCSKDVEEIVNGEF